MLAFITRTVQKLWEKWTMQGFVLLSLCMQVFLVLFAPFRKRTANNFVILSIGAVYLLADWIAGFAVGLIANFQRQASGPVKDGDLQALWAAILLLHIGGPDTITAFNLFDNELWQRQLFGLAAQIIAAGYIFFQTLPHNELQVPILLLFGACIIKLAQRIRALYVASTDVFRQSALYADEETNQSLHELKAGSFLFDWHQLDMVWYAKRYHDTMKELLVNVPLNISVRDASRQFFMYKDSEETLQLLSIELNLIYEAFFTKMVVVHGVKGCILLSTILAIVAISLAWFYFVGEKLIRNPFNRGLTYTLLIGSLILDFVSLFMLVFSDRTVAKLNVDKMTWKMLLRVLDTFLSWKRNKWKPCAALGSNGNEVLGTPLLFRRWSESISGFNLVGYCLKMRPRRIRKPRWFSDFRIEKIIRHPFDKLNNFLSRFFVIILCKEKCKHIFIRDYYRTIHDKAESLSKRSPCFNNVLMKLNQILESTGLRQMVDKWRFTSNDPLTKELWEFILLELRKKYLDGSPSEIVEKTCSARGEIAIERWNFGDGTPEANLRFIILRYITLVNFYQSIMIWHLATDMCYYTEDRQASVDYREISKDISDYMLYLLIMQPGFMPSVTSANARTEFDMICAELQGFLIEKKDVEGACKELFETNAEAFALTDVLYGACMLAGSLKKVDNNKWELISKVWVEMLSYSAIHCDASAHIQQLGRGGELASFVWLLMAHLGVIHPSLLPHHDQGSPGV